MFAQHASDSIFLVSCFFCITTTQKSKQHSVCKQKCAFMNIIRSIFITSKNNWSLYKSLITLFRLPNIAFLSSIINKERKFSSKRLLWYFVFIFIYEMSHMLCIRLSLNKCCFWILSFIPLRDFHLMYYNNWWIKIYSYNPMSVKKC